MSEAICQTQIILLEVDDTELLLDWGKLLLFLLSFWNPTYKLYNID